MKYVSVFSGRAVLSLLAIGVASYLGAANAQVQSGQVLIRAVQGPVTYTLSGHSKALKENVVLPRGALIKTGAESTVDLVLQYNGTVLRLMPNSTLGFDKLNQQEGAERLITETSLNLKAGSLVGIQRKLAAPSWFEVNIPSGVIRIKGTEYVVRADGSVTVISGSVEMHFNLPGNGGSVFVTVPAGSSFDPATGQVVPTTPSFLASHNFDIVAQINSLNAATAVYKAGGATIVIKPGGSLTPTRGGHGNNGVGNGEDPQPPGNPPINDGPGTSPGNPGNRQHGNGHGP